MRTTILLLAVIAMGHVLVSADPGNGKGNGNNNNGVKACIESEGWIMLDGQGNASTRAVSTTNAPSLLPNQLLFPPLSHTSLSFLSLSNTKMKPIDVVSRCPSQGPSHCHAT